MRLFHEGQETANKSTRNIRFVKDGKVKDSNADPGERETLFQLHTCARARSLLSPRVASLMSKVEQKSILREISVLFLDGVGLEILDNGEISRSNVRIEV